MFENEVRFVDEKVAVSPMPHPDELRRLAKKFTSVVVLVTPEELGYDIEEWKLHGVENVLHSPVEDWHPPTLHELYKIVKFILESPGKVLVHCFGGIGRSGTVAASYLAAKGASDPLELIDAVGCFLNPRQERMFRIFSYVVSIGFHKLEECYRVGDKYWFGKGPEHAFKALEEAAEIEMQLNLLSMEERAALVAASLLHDIGASMIGNGHHEETLRLLLIDENRVPLEKALGKDAYELALWTAYHHRKNTNPLTCTATPSHLKERLKLTAGIVRVADALGHDFVDRVVVQRSGEGYTMTVYCEKSWMDFAAERTRKKVALLREAVPVLDVEVAEEDDYWDFEL